MPEKKALLLGAVLAGAAAGLGHAPFNLTPLAFGALAAAFVILRLRPGFLSGFAFGLGYFAYSLNWIVQPFLVVPEDTGWMAPFALVLMAAGMALFYGFAARLALVLGNSPLALALSFTIAEVLRASIFTGFPWAMLGYLFLPINVVQFASLFGPYFLTFLLLFPLSLIGAGDRVQRIAGGTLFGLVCLMHFVLVPPPLVKLSGEMVRIVQPALDQAHKWNPELANQHFTTLGELSVAEPTRALTIWPETAFPWAYVDNDPLWQIMGQRLDAPLVTGVVRISGRSGWNSVVLSPADGRAQVIYDKHHLVPFGEYLPLPGILSLIGLKRLTPGEGFGYEKGPGPVVVDLPVLGPSLILICYEALFPRDLVTPGQRPRVILHLTNDAWFGTFSGPYQHLDQVRLRAIELGLPVIRAANTGISAVIDPYGRVLDSLPLGQRGTLDYPVPDALPATLYARLGDLPMLVFLFALLGLLTQRWYSRLTR